MGRPPWTQLGVALILLPLLSLASPAGVFSDAADTEIVTTGFFERVVGSVGGMLFGLIALFVAGALLFWNEGRTLRTRVALSEGLRICREVDARKVLSENENYLVHVTGTASAVEPALIDPIFNVAAANCIKLRRVVEMFQWRQTVSSTSSTSMGTKTTSNKYSYEPAWSTFLVDSSRFYNSKDHPNPTDMKGFRGDELCTREARVGCFTLPLSMVSAFPNYRPVPLDPVLLSNLSPSTRPTAIRGDYLYFGRDPDHPQVGDVRVSFQAVDGGPVSIVAKQTGSTFAPYQPSPTAAPIQIFSVGLKTLDEQISRAAKENKVMTWVLRILGCCFFWIGWATILEPVATVFDLLPLVGDLVRLGVGWFSFLSALIWTFAVASFAWLLYRPVKGLVLLSIALGLLLLGSRASVAASSSTTR